MIKRDPDQIGEITHEVDIADLSRGRKSIDDQRAYLVVVAGPCTGQMIPVPIGSALVGRGSGAHLVIDDSGISRRHVRLHSDAAGRVVLTDLGSRNGTYVNGERVSEVILSDGDKISMGSTIVLKFTHGAPLESGDEEQMFAVAVKDRLTGLFSKQYFVDRFASEFAFALRTHTPLSLVLAEIDSFADLVERFGAPAGDIALRSVAVTIGSAIRTEDTIARYDDTRFVILGRESDRHRSFLWAERLRKMVESKPVLVDGAPCNVSVSMGIATLERTEFNTLDEMLNDARRYLDHARDAGGNRVESSLLAATRKS